MAEASETVTGGCQCGRIRYSAQIESRQAYLCHCRMCQRATGGVAAAFVGVEKASVSWSTEPDWYASSPIAQRPFCATCGTPLGFAYPDAAKMDLTVGSLDDSSGFVPISHFGAETINEVWLDTRALPRDRCDSYPSLVARWERAKER
ncbi:MAG: aldehyde-activating protein [Sphingobium sp.]|nr:aldehyde-activating protein [Sphingobium sp.]